SARRHTTFPPHVRLALAVVAADRAVRALGPHQTQALPRDVEGVVGEPWSLGLRPAHPSTWCLRRVLARPPGPARRRAARRAPLHIAAQAAAPEHPGPDSSARPGA